MNKKITECSKSKLKLFNFLLEDLNIKESSLPINILLKLSWKDLSNLSLLTIRNK